MSRRDYLSDELDSAGLDERNSHDRIAYGRNGDEISTLEKLERLFDLDYEPKIHGRPRPFAARDFRRTPIGPERKAAPWAAFTLGVGLPVLAYLWVPLVPQLIDLIPSQPHRLGGGATRIVSPEESVLTTPAADPTFAKIAGLSAQRSTITGVVDPNTLSGSYYWSMILQNNTSGVQEARMEFSLPEGAVVSRATLWINGREEEAAFNSTANVQEAYDWIVSRHRDPLIVTKQSTGKILVKMSPVPADGGKVKLRLGITAPLQATGGRQTAFKLPVMRQSNFNLECTQDVHLASPLPIRASAAGFDTTRSAGEFTLRGNVLVTELPALTLQTGRQTANMRFATRATHALPGSYIVASVQSEPESNQTKLRFEKILSKPDCPIIKDEDAAHRISTLWASQEIERICSTDTQTAVQLGTAYRIVSDVTGAVVLETESDYQQKGLHRQRYQTLAYGESHEQTAHTANRGAQTLNNASAQLDALGNSSAAAPVLQGAMNSTVGPEGSDATVITGVNTAGTVRVSGLRQAEQVTNHALRLSGSIGQGLGNWLVASERDANLFDAGPSADPTLWIFVSGMFIALPFMALNFCGPMWLLLQSFLRARRHRPGARKALVLGLAWLSLALLLPDISILAMVGFGIISLSAKIRSRQCAR